MTRRYTQEKQRDTVPRYTTVRCSDGTTYEGRNMCNAKALPDVWVALELPYWIARGEVTPVPVDLKREAAKFARGKR